MTGVVYAVLGLPIPTIFPASSARRIGAFGLVWPGLTNPYHAADLALPLLCEAFTKHYHRDGGLHIDVSVVAGIGHRMAGVAQGYKGR